MRNDLSATIEALLFVYGEALSVKKLSSLAKATETEVKEALEALKERLDANSSGLTLIQSQDEARLITKPSLGPVIEHLIKDDFDETLTPAAIETLTLILYLSPVSRAEIDFIRGVNSSFILRSLVLRGLISRGVDPKRPYIYLYQPTFELLQYLGVSGVNDLPDYEKYRAILRDREEQQKEEIVKKDN